MKISTPGSSDRIKGYNISFGKPKIKPIEKLKKIGYLILITIIFLQTGGVLVIYKMHQSLARGEMHTILNCNDTQYEKLTLSMVDYQKAKIDANEILIQGKLYDIKSIILIGGNANLLIIHDSLEEKILKKIKDFITGNHQSNKKLPYQLLKFLSMKFLPPEDCSNPFVPAISNDLKTVTNQIFTSSVPNIDIPPPKVG